MKPFLLACAAVGIVPAMGRAQGPVATPALASPAHAASGATRLEDARRTVQEGWARYDKDGNGTLDPLEFGTWVMTAAVARDPAGIGKARLSAAKVLNGTSAAFARADANRDRRITRAELTAFLGS